VGDRSIPGVLHVVLSLCPGGTERLVIEMTRRTADMFPTAVCCLDERGAWAGELAGCGVNVVALGRRPGFHPGLSRRVAAVARATGARVLHCHQYTPFVYGRIALVGRKDLRLVYTEHGRLSGAAPSFKRRLVNPLLGRFPGRTFAVSRELRDYMVCSGFSRERVEVIYNGIEPCQPPAPAQRHTARQRLGLADDCLVVGTVARLDPVKDLGTLITAFARVLTSVPSALLLIVGDGSERERLERQAATLNIASRTVFTGQRADVRELLPALDVFVNSSTSEGVSVTILEAMAAGLPVVATSVGGTPEVVVDGVTGALVPAGSADRLAGVLTATLSDSCRRAGQGAAGRRRLEETFTMDRMLAEYLRAYEGESGQEA
jgi:L-malate glycosyltransferase